MTGGFFLALSYFGTDQSQVQRYLSGRSITESRLGLLFNGLLKIPMQFLILFVGVMVFVFHQFHPHADLLQPGGARARARRSPRGAELRGAGADAAGGLRAQAGRRSPASRPRSIGATPAAARAAADGVRAARAGEPGRARPGARGDRARAAARPRQRHRLHLHLVRDEEPAARPGRPAAGGDPVRRDVVDRQRADRARRHQRGRFLQAQRAPRRERSPLPARRAAVHRRLGRAGGAVRRRRLAGRQPDPGGQHPRLAVLRHDPGAVPGGVLPQARRRGRGLRGGAAVRDAW